MTPEQLQILQHALGADEYGQTPKYASARNFYNTDDDECAELVALGFMVEFPKRSWIPGVMLAVTDAGKLAMREASPKPPKLTRSQLRYRRFLDADCDMSFRDWIRYEQDSRFKAEPC